MTEESNTEQPQVTPGPLLRHAREKLGLSDHQVAQRLNLRLSVVQGIERDVYETNTSITYIRGYIRNYARLVGLEESELNDALNATYRTEPTQEMQSFSERTKREKSDGRWQLLTWGIALVLMAAVGWWAYSTFSDNSEQLDLPKPTSLAEPSSQTTKVSDMPNTVAPESPVSVDESQPNLRDDLQFDDSATSVELVAMEASDTIETVPVEIDISDDIIEEAKATQAQTVEEALVINLTDDCWMLVEDASGNRLVEGLKLAGFSTEISGLKPYKLRLGAPEAVQLSFNGEAIDLSSFKAGKVARLSVPQ